MPHPICPRIITARLKQLERMMATILTRPLDNSEYLHSTL